MTGWAKHGFAKYAFTAALLALSTAVWATTFPVDDSASQVQGSNLRMQWDALVPIAGQPSTISGVVNIIVRLNVSQWRGHQGRIYMVLPSQPSGPLTASWTTRGPLQPGVLQAGERMLVYAGPIESDVIEDTMRLTLQTDGRRLVRSEQVLFSFEIDVGAP
jgi:hypothetical protein